MQIKGVSSSNSTMDIRQSIFYIYGAFDIYQRLFIDHTNVSMDLYGKSYREIKRTIKQHSFQNINHIGCALDHQITGTPLRIRQNQIAASIQKETPQFKLLSTQKSNYQISEEQMPIQIHRYNHKHNQKENHVLLSEKESAFPFRKLKSKVEINSSLTPKHRLHTEFFPEKQAGQQVFKKYHRKKLSTDLDCGNILNHRLSFKLLLQSRCKATRNKSQDSQSSEGENESCNFFKRLKQRPGKNQQEQYLRNETYPRQIVISRKEHIKCSNNHGKNARYKVVSRDSLGSNQLYFCSRCTIPLLHQGFILQEITYYQPSPQSSAKQPSLGSNLRTVEKIRLKQNNTVKMLEQLRTEEDRNVQDIDSYYQDLLKLLMRLRDQDKEVIQAYYLHMDKQLNRKLSHIDQIIELLNLNRVNSSSVLMDEGEMQPKKILFTKTEAKDKFIQQFYCELRPDLNGFHTVKQQGNANCVGKDWKETQLESRQVYNR